jgi:hypothetical protein
VTRGEGREVLDTNRYLNLSSARGSKEATRGFLNGYEPVEVLLLVDEFCDYESSLSRLSIKTDGEEKQGKEPLYNRWGNEEKKPENFSGEDMEGKARLYLEMMI